MGGMALLAKKKERYEEYRIEPVEIHIQGTLGEMIEDIKNRNLDCLLLDYRLSSYASVSYSGVDIAESIEAGLYSFPIFILTSYEDDLYSSEVFDAHLVFRFERYLEDAEETIELNSKIIEQVIVYKKNIKMWEEELIDLLPHFGERAEIDSRILELDGYIERSIDGKHCLDQNTKNQLACGKIEDVIKKLDTILERME